MLVVRKIDWGGVFKRLEGMRARSKAFQPVFRWVLKELQLAHAANFASHGALVGGWKPLDPEYASWKLANYGANGILVRKGDLQGSLTFDNSRGAVRDIGRTRARFGTSIAHAGFHQTGTTNMAQRKVVFVPKGFALATAHATADHIVYGNEGNQLYQNVKGIFKS